MSELGPAWPAGLHGPLNVGNAMASPLRQAQTLLLRENLQTAPLVTSAERAGTNLVP